MTVAELRDALAEMAGSAIVRVEGDGVAYEVSKDWMLVATDGPPADILVVTIKGGGSQ